MRLRLDGPDEAEAMAAVVDLFERRFDEEGETAHTPAQPAGSG